MRAVAIAACVTLLGVSCSKDEGPAASGDVPSATDEAASTTVDSEPASEPTSEPDAELDDEDIPVAEDYEQQAAEKITAENFEKEFEKIEKELAGEAPG